MLTCPPRRVRDPLTSLTLNAFPLTTVQSNLYATAKAQTANTIDLTKRRNLPVVTLSGMLDAWRAGVGVGVRAHNYNSNCKLNCVHMCVCVFDMQICAFQLCVCVCLVCHGQC